MPMPLTTTGGKIKTTTGKTMQRGKYHFQHKHRPLFIAGAHILTQMSVCFLIMFSGHGWGSQKSPLGVLCDFSTLNYNFPSIQWLPQFQRLAANIEINTSVNWFGLTQHSIQQGSPMCCCVLTGSKVQGKSILPWGTIFWCHPKIRMSVPNSI